MLHDIRLLLWLRIRHARTAFSRMMHLAGTDPASEGGLGERTYQLYIVAFVAVALVLLWAALLDAVATVFASMGAAGSYAVLSAALVVLPIAFAVGSINGLRTAPLKFSHPDITYLAAGALRMRAIALVDIAVCAVLMLVLGALLGYLLGAGVSSGTQAAFDPLAVAALGSLGAAAVVSAGRLAGAIRLAVPRWRLRHSVGAAVIVFAIAAACVFFGMIANPSSVLSDALPLIAAAFGVVALAGIAVFAALAERFDRVLVIEESALFADLQPFGAFSPLDQTVIQQYRRRKKLAARRRLFSLSQGTGRRALVARACLSAARQYEGLPSLFVQGTLIVPFGACALLGLGGPIALLFWLQALLLFSQGAREQTRAFRDDVRNRLVRDRLPFDTLELFAFDTLPAFVFVAVLSLGASVALSAFVPLVWMIPLCLLVNALGALICALDAIRFSPKGKRASYEMGALLLVAALGPISLAGAPLLTVAASLVAGALLVSILRRGIECA